MCRISLLKLWHSTADPRDIKAPCAHLLLVEGIKSTRGARLAIIPTPLRPPHQEYIYIYTYIHVVHAHSHVNQMLIVRESDLWTSHTRQIPLSRSPQLRGHMALIPWERPRSELGHRHREDSYSTCFHAFSEIRMYPKSEMQSGLISLVKTPIQTTRECWKMCRRSYICYIFLSFIFSLADKDLPHCHSKKSN